jgi:hypothetical protein
MASKHVEKAQKLRELVNQVVHCAQSDATAEKPKSLMTYCLIGDYCQNMSAPLFRCKQPGAIYFFSPLNVYSFGLVDVAFTSAIKLYVHIYHEGERGKGGINVASMIVETLRLMGLIPSFNSNTFTSNEPAGKLSIVMGQLCRSKQESDGPLTGSIF